MTIGEDRVRVQFNPSANDLVSRVKQDTAKLIDVCANLPKPEDESKKGEFLRLTALAMTHYEDAAMWAVKAATISK
jgi:hypothetical protein